MCGIAGILTTGKTVDPTALQKMAQVLRHRGPDDHGIWHDGHIGMAQTRLSIIDLAGGHQPLINSPLTLAANGEIYNHIELRETLEQRGRRFATHSDSETILHSYAVDNAGFINDLRGMFAFALYDTNRRQLTLARDRLGIKPLFYCITGGQLIFASEIKAILAVLPQTPELNPAALHQYLQNQFNTGRDTIFRQIHRILPGEIITIDDQLQLQQRRYWSATKIQPRETDFPTAQAEFNSLFDEVMTQHMRADVPFGLFLSGGVDSAILAAALTRLQSKPLRSYSIGFANVEMKDELDDAQRIATLLGTNHQAIRLDARDIFNRLPHSIWAADDLMRDYASLPTSILAEHAARELKVVFSGEGGDEVFAGYRRYRPGIEQAAKNLLRPGSGGFRTRGQWHDNWANKVFGDRLKAANNTMREPFINAWRETPKSWSNIQRRQYIDLTTALPDNLLVKADRMLMSFGLEGRVPFLDHRIVEFGLALPDNLKIESRQGKVFLKRWAEQWIPKNHLWQKKRGFHVPVGEWLHGDFLDKLIPTLKNNPAVQEWFQPRQLDNLLATQQTKGKLSREVFTILQFAIWHQIFIENNGAQPDKNIDLLTFLNQ